MFSAYLTYITRFYSLSVRTHDHEKGHYRMRQEIHQLGTDHARCPREDHAMRNLGKIMPGPWGDQVTLMGVLCYIPQFNREWKVSLEMSITETKW